MKSPKTIIRSPFGEYLHNKMQQAGMLEMKDLSEAAGLTKSHPTLLIYGYCHPSPTTARRLADVFGVPYDELWQVVLDSRREWGRRRRAGRCGRDFNVNLHFATSRDNADWLRGISERAGKSMSQTVSSIIMKARTSEDAAKYEFYQRRPLTKSQF